MGGTTVKWAQRGHHVKLVSVTNGDIGHWRMAGGPLAQRRTAEVHEAARRIGTTAEVLDIHDGEPLPTLENRKKMTRLIREWATGSWQKRQGRIAKKYRQALIDRYGDEAGKAVKYAEAFEVCECRRRATHP